MANVGQLWIELGADVARLRKDMGEASSVVNHFKGEAENAFKSIQNVAIGYLSFKSITAMFKETVAAAAEEERSLLRLEAVLKAHNVTNKEVVRIYDDMSKEMQLTTRYTDDQIRSAQELLTTMGVAPSKMRAAIEASVQLGIRTGDVTSAAQVLGQAFEGNYKQLRRLIPQLKDAEKGQIDFNSVLKIIRENYGDTAQREMEGYIGEVDKLKKEWEDFGKDLGGMVVPALTEVVKQLRAIGHAVPDAEGIQAGLGSPWMAADIANKPKTEEIDLTAQEKKQNDQYKLLVASLFFTKPQIDKNTKDTAMTFEQLRDLWIKAEAEKYAAAEELNEKWQEDVKKGTEKYYKDWNDLQLKNSEFEMKTVQENTQKSWEIKSRQIQELNQLELAAIHAREEATNSLFNKIISMANSAGEYGEGAGLMAANFKSFLGSYTGNDEWASKLTAAQDYYNAVAKLAQNDASYRVQLEEASNNLTETRKAASFGRTANMYSSMLGIMAGAALSYYRATGKQSEAAFAVYKAIAVAQTVISTIAATQEAYKTGLQVTNSMGGGVAFAAIAAAVGAARVAQIMSTDPGNASASLAGVSAGGYTYTSPDTPTWEEDSGRSRAVNVYVYGNVIDHQEFARTIVPYLEAATDDGVH